jgi:hypothetical protein
VEGVWLSTYCGERDKSRKGRLEEIPPDFYLLSIIFIGTNTNSVRSLKILYHCLAVASVEFQMAAPQSFPKLQRLIALTEQRPSSLVAEGDPQSRKFSRSIWWGNCGRMYCSLMGKTS